jgi:hypothetical protein
MNKQQLTNSSIKIKKLWSNVILICSLLSLILSSCQNPFELLHNAPELSNGEKALVSIYIGNAEPDVIINARTTIPNQNAVEGYQLTFTGGNHEPVNISGTNQTQVLLGNGVWTITATAYRLGGVIGNNSDAIATGNINISINAGFVVGGIVPPIIVKPVGTGTGTLHYAVNVNDGITGTLTLWNINGSTKITGFGINGDLDLSLTAIDGLVNGFYNLATGRYIAEVKLINQAGNIAFRREVIEIWRNTITTFAFEPSLFFDPNVLLPNSNAVLCETTTAIGGIIIGVGSGSGLSEADPKTYICYPVNESINLIFQYDSLFSTVSWVNNAGNLPSGAYHNIGMPSALDNLITNNVLWVKAVSEDNSKTMYYRFNIIPPTSYGDFNVGGISLATYADSVLTINAGGSYTIGMKTGVTSTTNRIVVTPGVEADITLSGVNINVSSINNACAFDMTGATVNLTLVGNNVLISGANRAGLQVPEGSTLVITTSSTGSLAATGSNGAGIGGGGWNSSGGTITINGGTVTATGGWGGAGIGGGGGGAGGTITINGGTVTATGGWNDAGIGGSNNGAGGTINAITGNAVIFASSIQPELPTGDNMGHAIVFDGIDGTMYGDVTLQQDITIPTGRVLYISSGQSLTIPSGITLMNNGTIIKRGNVSGTIAGNQPVEPVFTVSGSSAYTYSGGVLTITGNGTYTIGMRDGVSSTTVERIVVLSDVEADITLSGVNINVSSIDNACAFDMTGATVNLTLVGNNVLISGANRAGLQVPEGSTLVITTSSTGSLTATGASAGIGGGWNGSGGTISINGGTVTATTGSWGGAGIGGGWSGAGGTINAITGNAVIFASSIRPELPTGVNMGPAIVFNGIDGTMYGNVELERNITIPSGRILEVQSSQTLTIKNGYTLTNNGTIIKRGNIYGTIAGNQPVEPAFMVSGSSAYTYSGGVLTITGNGSYTIGMRSGISSTVERIVVSSGVEADITLSDVNINVSSINNACAFDMTGATVNLTLVGNNVLISGENRAGLQTPNGSTLVITDGSTGSLTATGSNGAGIGGGWNGAGGTITINGGTVTATGDSSGAGIGGGNSGAGGTISINGGTVTATGSWGGAGIGGGWSGAGGTISTINGNAVVFASSIQPELPTGDNLGPAIVFIGNNGTMYNNVLLNSNVTFPTGRILSISSNQSLVIPNSITLTNNGTISNNGVIINNGTINGTGIITGNQPVQSPSFVAVTGINGVPIGTAGTQFLLLSGNVVPANAANQIITWSVKDAGTTGANIISGNILNTTAAGAVTVTASIANGTAHGINFTQDFSIKIEPPAGIGIGNPSVNLYMSGTRLQNGGTTTLYNEAGIITINITSGTYSEIIWYLNGNVVAQGASRTAISLSRQIPGMYQVTVEATPLGGIKNSGSHNFIVQ